MSRRNRDTLKKYFEKGRLPSEEHFGDLIDSMLNMIDEGFDKTLDQGLKIYPSGDSEKYISFFGRTNKKSPLWSFNVNSKTKNFEIRDVEDKTVISISGEGRVGVGKDDPDYALDVQGTIAGEGRVGTFAHGCVPADGLWHDILEGLDGCRAFEVMAGVGKKHAGKYSLLHAVALSTFNSKDSIKSNTAYYGSRCNRLKLKWEASEDHEYCLRIKTCCDYGEPVKIQYNITSLWFDPLMKGCEKREE